MFATTFAATRATFATSFGGSPKSAVSSLRDVREMCAASFEKRPLHKKTKTVQDKFGKHFDLGVLAGNPTAGH